MRNLGSLLVLLLLGITTAVPFVSPTPAESRVLELVQELGVGRLGGPLAMSPDGRHLYIGGGDLTVLARDPSTATLSFIETQPVTASSLAISPDGRHVYAVRSSVVVFERNTHGALRHVETWNLYDAARIGRARIGTISPDGRHLYVAGREGVAVFARDSGTGALSLIEAHLEGIGGLYDATAGAVSPDGLNLYLAGPDYSGIAVFARDALSGELSFVQAQPDGAGDSAFRAESVAVSPDGRNLYVASRFSGTGAVVVFLRDGSAGELSFVEAHIDGVAGVDGLGGATSVAVSLDQRYVYATGRLDDAVAVFVRDAATGALSFSEAHFEGENGIDGLVGANSMALSPDGRHLYAGGSGDLDTGGFRGAVAAFEREASGSALLFAEALFGPLDGANGLEGATAVTVSPEGRHVYVASSWDGAVAVFERDSETRRLSFVEAHFDGEGGVDGLEGAGDVILSPEGRHLYVVGYWDDAVAAFAREEDSGRLSFVEAYFDFDRGINAIATSPDGRHLYAVDGDFNGVLTTYARDGSSGMLQLAEISHQLDGYGTALAVSPEGRHVYVGTEDDRTGAIEILARDASSGALTPVASLPDHFANSIVFGPDGRTVYVTSSENSFPWRGALSVFAREEDMGLLTLVDLVTASFFFPRSVAVSPDDRQVYLVDYELSVYARDAGSGPLGLVEIETRPPGLGGVRRAEAVAVSPDGRSVYVASGNSLYVLERPGDGCQHDLSHLCLNGNRFRVDVEWRDYQGLTGSGRVAPYNSDDSGLFWFFSEDNWEMLIKVLDGCGINDRYWVFAAATTDVEYRLQVTDTATGDTRSYFNPLGSAAPAFTDSDAFATCAAAASDPSAGAGAQNAGFRLARPIDSPGADRGRRDHVGAEVAGSPGRKSSYSCRETPAALCLSRYSRFRVEVEWQDHEGHRGVGRVGPFGSTDSGLLWFFSPDNWEMLVKVLDGCALNDHYWVYAAATTDVQYTLRVTDTESGEVSEYENALGNAAEAITDAQAFACAP